MKKAKITTVKKGPRMGQFKFQLIAANGEPIAQSYPESYTQKHNAIEVLEKNFPDFVIEDTTIKKS